MKTERFGRLLLSGILLVLFAAIAAAPFFLPEAKLSVRVLDEEGKPVQGAEVGMGFEGPAPKGKKSVGRSGLTNSEGLFEASAPTSGHVTYGAIKDGYYRTVGKPMDFWKHKLNRWQPWNPTMEVVLKRIVNPVPMYARSLRLHLPVDNRSAGYDLVEGDWVAPRGQGKVSDFVITLQRRIVGDNDFDVVFVLAFSNRGDGILPIEASESSASELRLPRLAPENGYMAEWRIHHTRSPNACRKDEEGRYEDFFFRVRTVQKDGRVERAMYGKLRGAFKLGQFVTQKPVGRFTYYLNPDGTRNMEFDPNRNLFKDLKGLEEVRVP
jgi:hypothetical protein